VRAVAIAWLVLGTLLAVQRSAAADLPNPLTLEQALALAEQPHPDTARVEADLALAQADRLAAESRQGLRAYVDLAPRLANPSNRSGVTNDSQARLLLSRSLYDFGRTRAYLDAADAGIVSQQYALLDTRLKRRIDVQAAFYDVLLADLRYAVDNEDMSHLYVIYDRIRDRNALGQVSDVALLEAQNHYLEALDRRTASANAQRTTRQWLALSLNRPDQMPADLDMPPATATDRHNPDFSALFAVARKANPKIISLQQKVLAATAEVRAARAAYKPVLSADLELGRYARNLSARSDAGAGLNLRIPLYQGGEAGAAVARAGARLAADQAELAQALMHLQQRLLERVQQLDTLAIKRQSARQRLRYRELSLDRQRALYEMERQTSLGDALTKMTEADWLAARIEFQTALTRAQIDALLGRPALNNLQDTSP